MTQATQTLPVRTFTLDTGLRDDAVARIERANRRAARLGLDPYFYEIGEAAAVPMYDDETIRRARRAETIDGARIYFDANGAQITPDWYRDMITLTVEGITPTLPGGWVIAGMVDMDDAMGVQVRVFADNIAVDNRDAYTGDDWQDCQHCHTMRNRAKMFLLMSSAGDIVKVGTTCVGAFLGIDITIPDGYCGALSEDLDDLCGAGGWAGAETFDTLTVLALSLSIAHEHGWVSSTKAMETGLPPSGEYLKALMFARKGDLVSERHALLDTADMGEAADVLTYARNMTGASEYACRVREIAACQTVSARNLAILGSAVGGYLRDKAAERAAALVRESAWVGKEKDKLAVRVTVIDVVCLPDYGYGESDKVKMADQDGNVLVWTTKASHPGVEWAGTLTATVKNHSEYRDVKETNVLRCKFDPAA